MSKVIDNYIENNNIEKAIEESKNMDFLNLSSLLSDINKTRNFPYILPLEEINNLPREKIIKVKLYCNWLNSKQLCDLWNKMSKGNYTWNNIKVCWDDKYDYQVVINMPLMGDENEIQKDKTIVFRMEPYMEKDYFRWGGWSNPDPSLFLSFNSHSLSFNNCEWHLSKTYSELMTESIFKDYNIQSRVSTVLSSKYSDPGHKKRINFSKFLNTKDDICLDVYGQDLGYKNFKGSLPLHNKDNGLFPYKYTFNAENNQIDNYFTEKILDAILAECLIFYNGPRNIRDYIDERAFVWLDLEDFEHDYLLIKKAIEEDWWFDRISYIRAEKQKILNEYQFFPRIEKIINSLD